MNCQEMHKLVHAYVDGELDLLRSVEIDQHLQECVACAQAYTELEAIRTALKDNAPYFQAPSSLRKRIRSSVRKASRGRAPKPVFSWRVLASAAAIAFVAITFWALVSLPSHPPADVLLAQELVGRHVGAQMLATHLVDVKSSDQHTVKPWFNGKVDFSPPVRDLSGQDFPLIGGRLEYVNDRPVTALVYQRREHVINLFIWPAPEGAQATIRTETRQGYHLLHWTQAGMTFWAVSDLNEAELQQFARLLQEKGR